MATLTASRPKLPQDPNMTMAEVIALLKMKEHPEGGYYAVNYVCPAEVRRYLFF